MCIFKFLKGHVDHLAKHLQPANCIAKEQNVIINLPYPGKVWFYRRQRSENEEFVFKV